MKEIQPIQVWINGSLISVNQLSILGLSDNMLDTAVFNYYLLDSQGNQIISSSLEMTGFDYESYNTSPDSNNYAYSWIASKLNLTII
jgi:hypothetical protein